MLEAGWVRDPLVLNLHLTRQEVDAPPTLGYSHDRADILEFVDSCVASTFPQATKEEHACGDPFWERRGRLLYVALIGHLVHCTEKEGPLALGLGDAALSLRRRRGRLDSRAT